MRLKLDENFTVEDVTVADVHMQKIYLERNRVSMIAQSAIFTFFLYLLVGMIGLMKAYFNVQEFMIMLTMGLAILFIATHPYMKSLKDENDFLNSIEKKIKSKKMKIARRHLIKK